MNSPSPASRAAIQAVCRALLDKKALEVRVLDVSAGSSITDTMIVASGTSEPHLRALRIAVDEALTTVRARALRQESAPESGWTVIDAFDLIVHLLTEEQRERYRLEHLWRDAVELDLAEVLAEPKPPAKRKPPAKAKAAAKAKPAAKARRRKS